MKNNSPAQRQMLAFQARQGIGFIERISRWPIFSFYLLLVCIGGTSGSFAAMGASAPYFADFEGPAGPEWSATNISVTPVGGRHFLGEFGNQTATLSLSNLPTHLVARVEADLFILRTWDGNWTGAGPDIWSLQMSGGPFLLRTTFGNGHPASLADGQAFPGSYPGFVFPDHSGASEVNSLGYLYNGGQMDAVYHLGFTFAHTGTNLALAFSASGLEGLANESWGLDNVRVELLTNAAGILAFKPSAVTVFENVTNAVVNVIRVGGSAGSVSVDYATSDGTAIAGSDYGTVTGTLTFADGETNKTISVPIIDDAISEPSEFFLLSLTNPVGGAALGALANIPVQILDDDGRFELGQTNFVIAECTAGLSIPVRWIGLTNDLGVSVQYTTRNGTAASGSDYTAASGTLSFPAGQTNGTIFVRITDDALVETDETFSFILSSSGLNARLTSQTNAAITILDNDSPSGAGPGVNWQAQALTVQPDGKLLIGGGFTQVHAMPRNSIVRLNSDGSVDTSFNPGSGANNWVETIALQPDGKIIIAGWFATVNGMTRNRIARLNANGFLDALFNPGAGANDTVYKAAVQPDGKVLLAGAFTTMGGVSRNRIARLNADGTLDTSFVPGSGANNTIWGMALQPDGRIVISGAFSTFNGVSEGRIARLNSDGSLDNSFSVGSGMNARANVILTLPDNKLLLGGLFTTINGVSANRMARLTTNGTLDTTFTVGIGPNSTIWSMALQPDGKVLAGGDWALWNGQVQSHLARVNPDGSLDDTFAVAPGANAYVGAVGVLPDGRVAAAGNFTVLKGFNRYRFALLGADGSLPEEAVIGVQWPAGSGGNDHWYALTSRPMDWTNAEAQGVSFGGHLVSVNSSNEQSFLEATFLKKLNTLRPFWIGFDDAATEGSFVWTSGETPSYTHWVAGEPNNFNNEDYGTLNWHYSANNGLLPALLGQWNDVPGSGIPTVYGQGFGQADGPFFGILELGDHPFPPIVLVSPQSVTNRVGSNVTFSVQATNGLLSYQWFTNGIPIPDATNSSLQLTNLAQNQNGLTFWALISNAGGSVTSAIATLTVWAKPAITVQPQSQTVVAGDSTAFFIEAQGTTPLGFRWRKDGITFTNGIIVSTPTNSSLLLTNVPVSFDGARFTVAVTNIAGFAPLSSSAVLTVLSLPAITNQPLNQSVVAGGNASFIVTAGGTPPFFYQWFFQGTNLIIGATNAMLTLINVQVADAGKYRVLISNAAGTVISTDAKLTVQPPPFCPGVGQAAGGGVDRIYDDGYVRVDVPGNAGGLTWFWGYINAAQVPGDGFIYFHCHGANWVTITDRYALNGVVPPLPPYGGTFAGPGPVFSDSPTRTFDIGPCLPPPFGLVAWWPGDGNANDMVGTNNGAFANGGFAPGKVRQAFSLSAVDGEVLVPDSILLNFGDVADRPFSFAAWIKRASLDEAGTIVSKYNSSAASSDYANEQYSLDLLADGTLEIALFDRIGDFRRSIGTANSAVTDALWHNVVATYNPDQGVAGLKLFLDGQEAPAAIVFDDLSYKSMRPTPEPFRIGNAVNSSGSNNSFQGEIDEVAIFNRALSPNEIAAIYAAGSLGVCAPVPLYVGVQGGGAVSRDPDQATYLVGDVVTLTAVNGRYYRFLAWSDGNDSATRDFVVGANNSLTAIFTNTVPLETLAFKQWDRSFGGVEFDNYPTIRATIDGGYVLAGATASDIGGNKTTPLCGPVAAWVVKLDAAGNKQWEQTVGAPGDTLYVVSIEPTSDGGYALGASAIASVSAVTNNCGQTSTNFGGYDMWLVRLDASGQRLWDRSFGGSGTDALSALRQTPDGGFLLTGLSDSPVSGNKSSPNFGGRDMWVVRTDRDGNKLWDRSFGGTEDDSAHKGLALLADGGFIALGLSASGVSGNKTAPNHGLSDFWLVRCDSAGNKVWDRSFGGTEDDFGTDLAVMPDGGVVLVGQSQSGASGNKTAPNYGDNDYWVIRCDLDGNTLWDSSFGGAGYDAAYAVQATADGGVVLSGESDSGANDGNRTSASFGGSDAWVVRLDANGQKVWEFPAGGTGYDYFWGVAAAIDGGTTFAGGSDSVPSGNKTSPNRGGEDFWVVHFTEREAPVGAPVALINGQFHSDNAAVATNSALVEIQTTFPTGRIFYTLDGSDPNGGLLYLGPFVVTESASIRAVAYSSDYAQSAETDPVIITILTGPSIIQPPLSQVIGENSMVTFSVSAEGTGPLSYQWSFNGTPVPNANSSVLALNNVQLSDAGDYSVSVSNSVAFVTSVSATLMVLALPGFSAQPASTNVALSASVTFCVSVNGTAPLLYQWRKNGVNVNGETNDCLTVDSVKVQDGGSYSVIVANPAGAITSADAALTVLVPQVPPGDDFSNRVVIRGAGDSVAGTNFFATREPGEPYHAGKQGSNSVWYTWQAPASGIATFRTSGSSFDTLLGVYTGTLLSGLTLVASDDDGGGFSTSLVRFNADAGEDYQIAIDGFAGAQGSFVLSWQLDSIGQTLPVILIQPLSQTATLDDTVIFTVVATGLSLTYQWFLEGQPLPGQTAPALTRSSVQGSEVGAYTVRISNALGQTSESQPAFLEIGPVAGAQSHDKFEDLFSLPAPSAPFRLREASAASASFVSVAAGTLQSQIFTTTNSTTQARETNSCGLIGGSSRWFLLQAATNGTLVIDTMGSAFDTVLSVYDGASLSRLTLLDCNNNAGPGVTWSRVVLPVTSGSQFNVAVDGVNGASGIVHLNWALGLAPTNSQASAPLRSLARVGGGLVLKSMVTGIPSLSYQWLLNQTNLAGATNATLVLTNIQTSQAGLYAVVASNFFGLRIEPVASLEVDGSLLTMAESAFENDSEGWSVFNSEETPQFRVGNGNPGGYISSTNQNWISPEKYLGNQSAAYGGLLQFDLKQSAVAGQSDETEVLLSGGGLTLVLNLLRNPGTSWTSYKVALQEQAGWKKDSPNGPPATQHEMLLTLGALAKLSIRSQSPQSTGALDNVALLAPADNHTVLLRSRRLNNFLLLEWPLSASGFLLQSATTLAPPNWADVISAPLISNRLNTFSTFLTNGAQYYRVRQP